METIEYYKQKLQPVVSYIRTEYANKISVAELEALAPYSYRNLQRVFKALFGETIGAFVSRLKVENGAKKLLYSSEGIKEIALTVGYADVASFSKAFKKYYGISPARYRSKKEAIFLSNHKKQKAMPFFEDTIVVEPAKTVFYTSFRSDYYHVDLDEKWKDFIAEAEELQLPVNSLETLGIIWDEPLISEYISYQYDACIDITDLPVSKEKFRIKELPAQRYAVFMHSGSYQRIDDTYDKIFSRWMLTSDWEVSEQPFVEKYLKHEGNTSNIHEYQTAIYIPLKG